MCCNKLAQKLHFKRLISWFPLMPWLPPRAQLFWVPRYHEGEEQSAYVADDLYDGGEDIVPTLTKEILHRHETSIFETKKYHPERVLKKNWGLGLMLKVFWNSPKNLVFKRWPKYLNPRAARWKTLEPIGQGTTATARAFCVAVLHTDSIDLSICHLCLLVPFKGRGVFYHRVWMGQNRAVKTQSGYVKSQKNIMKK